MAEPNGLPRHLLGIHFGVPHGDPPDNQFRRDQAVQAAPPPQSYGPPQQTPRQPPRPMYVAPQVVAPQVEQYQQLAPGGVDDHALLGECLDLLERVYHGRLFLPDAYDAQNLASDLIVRLRDRVGPPTPEQVLSRRLGNPPTLPADMLPSPNPSPPQLVEVEGVPGGVGTAGPINVFGGQSATDRAPDREPSLPNKVKLASEMIARGVPIDSDLGKCAAAVVQLYLEGND